MGEVEGLARRFADGAPGMPMWRAGLARVYCEQGRDAEARRELDRLAAHDFHDLPRDNVWLPGMALLAEVSAHLGDAERAGRLEELLEPYAERTIVSPHAMFMGPATRYLALAARVQGEEERAAAWLERARAAARTMNARPILAALEAEAGPAPAREPAPRGQAVMRREGEVWTLEHAGRTVRIRDGKGVRYLATLLANPGDEIHALELVQLDAGPAPPPTGDAGPRLDAEAKAAYRARVAELREELEEAERFHDPERAARAREEMEAIATELSAAVGLGGRDRPSGSDAERARVNVTRAIRTAVKRVAEHDADIGLELEATVHTGTFCRHEPDPRRPVEWRVEPA
jgi:hypothetical protein